MPKGRHPGRRWSGGAARGLFSGLRGGKPGRAGLTRLVITVVACFAALTAFAVGAGGTAYAAGSASVSISPPTTTVPSGTVVT